MHILTIIHRGDRVTYRDRFGKTHTGRAVMRGPYGWVLNMGGRHGTPAVVDERHIVKVGRKIVTPPTVAEVEDLVPSY